MPERIQLRRAAGWRMPVGTVKVDRSTRWGNPFIVGQHGTAEECVRLFTLLCACNVYMGGGAALVRLQHAYLQDLRTHYKSELLGKNLACWCRPGQPCHADVLLDLVNARP